MTVNFPEFIEKKYLEWQHREGKRKSVEDFAMYIGVSQSALSLWMGGKRTPSIQTTNLLAEIFGNEVYDVLGLPRPNPYQQRANRVWEFIPEERQKQIAEEAEKYAAQNQVSGSEESHKRRKTSKAK